MSLMKSMSQQINASLFIISAGLGLVESSECKPNYDITISGTGKSSVKSIINSNSFNAHEWWKGINSGDHNPIAKLINNKKNNLFIIALSRRYFDMIYYDIESLPYELLENIRIVGVKKTDIGKLDSCILPYDDRLNSANSPLPGTLSDYPQRCAVHYIKHIYDGNSLTNDIIMVEKSMQKLPWPTRKNGKKLSDTELIELIRLESRKTGFNKTKILRHLRKTLNIACEQKRFSTLYNKATW